MYQWTDPDTGTTQLSGKPPSWYRSGEAGPRVFVFEKGRIIDDTALDIPGEERQELRRQALVYAEEDKAAAKQKALEAEKLKATLDKNKQKEPAAETEQPIETEAKVETEQENTGEAMPEATEFSIDEMRALITDWEEKQTQQAKELVTGEEKQ